MKRIIISVCLLALVVCLAVPAFAASNWYNVHSAVEYFTRHFPYGYDLYNEYTIPQNSVSHYYGGNYYDGNLDWYNSQVGTSRNITFRYLPMGHGNSISISSLPEGSTSFKVTLPFDLALYYASASDSVSFSIQLRVGFLDDTGSEIASYPIIGRYTFNGSTSYVLEGTATIPQGADSFMVRVDFTVPVQNLTRIRTNAVPVVSPMRITNVAQPFDQVAQVIDPYERGSVSYDNNLELVTFKTNLANYVWTNTKGDYGIGNSFTFNVPMAGLDNEDVYGYPFGATGFVPCGGIPINSKLNFDFDATVKVPNATQTYQVLAHYALAFYDSEFQYLFSTPDVYKTYSDVSTADISIGYDIEVNTSIIAEASYFRSVFWLEFNAVEDETDLVSVTVIIDSSAMDVTIPYSSAFQLQEQGKITNEKLNEIQDAISGPGGTNDKLDDLEDAIDGPGGTNDKLDEIINGNVEAKPPQGSDIVGDLEDQEAGIRDDASNQFGEAEDFQASALDVIFMYAGAFSAFSLIFDAFTSIPLFAGLLYVSVAIGIFSFILGLSLDAAGADHEAQRDYQRRKNRRTIRRSRGKAY